MIEIIPNWHPLFVHFSVALLMTSALLHVAALMFGSQSDLGAGSKLEIVASWNLWIGTIFAVITVIAGWFAYNSVDHDTPSHLAMTDHKNWALVALGLYIVIATWSFLRAKQGIKINALMVLVVVLASGVLASTAWRGGELVYRYGLGVMSLPKASNHDHAGGKDHDHGSANQNMDSSSHHSSSIDDGPGSHSESIDADHSHGTLDHGKADHHNSSIDSQDSPAHSHDDKEEHAH